MSNRILGCDISKWQGKVNFEKMMAAGAKFVYIKASQGTFTDSKFYEHVAGAKAAGIPFGIYHFADPAYASAVDQANYFAALVNEVNPDLGIVLDMERTGGLTPSQLDRWGRDFCATLGWFGHVEIYTRISFWEPSVVPGTWAGAYPLWVARYAEYLPGPWSDVYYVPQDWNDWWMWQFSADGNGRGAEFGAESGSIDLNYMQCTEAEMREHYGLSNIEPPAPPTPPAPPVPDCCEELRAGLAALTLRVAALENGTPPPPAGYPCDMVVATDGGNLMLRESPETGLTVAAMPNGSRLTALGSPVADSQGRGDWLWCEQNSLRGWAAGWLLSPAGSDHPALPADTMEVVVTDEKLRVEYIVGYDKACSGKTPPGKPVMQPDEKNPIRYNQGDKITVRSGGQVFSCKDTPKTSTILTPGNIEYYHIADGEFGCNARFSDLYPAGGYVNAEKVRMV